MTPSPKSAALVLAATALALAPGLRPALAGWSAAPVEVHATTVVCPKVAVCEDRANGAIVVWQEYEATGGAGSLWAAHLLETGDLDPTWTSPRHVARVGATCAMLRAIPDDQGGAFITWMAGGTSYLLRIDSTGAMAPGWPTNGLALPGWAEVTPDGEGGLYVCGLRGLWVPFGETTCPVIALQLNRMGPDGAARSGWPAGGRTIAFNSLVPEWVSGCTIARDPSGDLWMAWTSCLLPALPETSYVIAPGDIRVLRLTAQGDPGNGWAPRGLRIAAFPAEDIPDGLTSAWWQLPRTRLVAITPDGSGGAYLLRGLDDWDLMGYEEGFQPRLHRLDAMGNSAGGWPADGVLVDQWSFPLFQDAGLDGSYRLIADVRGGVYAGFPPTSYDGPDEYDFARVTESGGVLWDIGRSRGGLEAVATAEGKLLLADFYPHGPTGIWDDYAHISCYGPESRGYLEWHSDILVSWYGDVGVASLRAGGAVFCWSQNRERFGVYALRLNPAGLVTDVPPAGPAPARLALRFVPGSGVRASAALAGAGAARLVLVDVAGRAVAREAFEAAGEPREWTLAGTATLAPGLYFGRVTRGAETHTARVVVTR